MPNRILKESICVSEDIDGLSWFEEIVFYRLIVNCDDYGRFDGRPAVIKSRLFPLKENLTTKAVSEAINRLSSAGLVTLYKFEGRPYLYLTSWNCHQQTRAAKSKYPDPEQADPQECCDLKPEKESGKNHVNPSDINGYQVQSNDIKCNQVKSNVPDTRYSIHDTRYSIHDTREQRAPAREEQPQDNGFETLWSAYPRKTGDISRAATEYLIAIDNGGRLEDMLSAIEWQKTQSAWTDQGGRFIPSLEKWLKNRGWEQKKPEKPSEKDYGEKRPLSVWDVYQDMAARGEG